MNIFFTSDPHFGHENILKYEPQRGKLWSTIDEHDEALVKRWNNVVKPNDLVYVLGDVGFNRRNMTELIRRLNGTKILILGNHDRLSNFQYLKMGFACVFNEARIKVGKHHIVLSHYPYRKPWYWKYLPWRYLSPDNHKRPHDHGLWLLHGHIHSGVSGKGSWLKNGRMINVGVDKWNYTPVSINKLLEMINEPALTSAPQP